MMSNFLDFIPAEVTLAGTQTLTNKTIAYADNTLTDVVGVTATQTLTNKTIDIANNTLTGVQPTLVSGTNIKTVGGQSVLGSGDLEVGGGAWEFLGALTASDSATLVFNDLTPANYSQFYFVIDRIKRSLSGFANLRVEASINNGVSYLGSESVSQGYAWVGSSLFTAISVESFMVISNGSSIDNTTNGGVSGSLLIVEPSNSQYKTAFSTVSNIQSDTKTNFSFENAGYTIWTTSSINAFKFSLSSGNLDVGTIRLYGLKKV
jgi:hypothetical protein